MPVQVTSTLNVTLKSTFTLFLKLETEKKKPKPHTKNHDYVFEPQVQPLGRFSFRLYPSSFCTAVLKTHTSTIHATGPNRILGLKAKDISNLLENTEIFHNVNLCSLYWYL